MTSSGNVKCLGGFISPLTPTTPSPNIGIDIFVDWRTSSPSNSTSTESFLDSFAGTRLGSGKSIADDEKEFDSEAPR